MSANSPEFVRSDEAASLWKSVLHAPSPRLATATRDALLEHTRALERTASELRVAIDSRELETWLRGGQLGALESALASLTDGASALALIPVDDVHALRADPSYSFTSFVASPANAAVRARARLRARRARGRRWRARRARRDELWQDSRAPRAPGLARGVARRDLDRLLHRRAALARADPRALGRQRRSVSRAARVGVRADR